MDSGPRIRKFPLAFDAQEGVDHGLVLIQGPALHIDGPVGAGADAGAAAGAVGRRDDRFLRGTAVVRECLQGNRIFIAAYLDALRHCRRSAPGSTRATNGSSSTWPCAQQHGHFGRRCRGSGAALLDVHRPLRRAGQHDAGHGRFHRPQLGMHFEQEAIGAGRDLQQLMMSSMGLGIMPTASTTRSTGISSSSPQVR